MFDWDHGIALHAMQGNLVSSRSEGEVSWLFSSCGRNLQYILVLRRGWAFKTLVCSATSGHLASHNRHLRNLLEAWQGNMDTSGGEVGDPVSLSSCHGDIGIPISFP